MSDVEAGNNPSPDDAPSDVQFPYGFFSFSIDNLANPGDAAVATLYLPKNASLNTYYLYGPTPDDTSNHWYEFMYDGDTGAEIIQDAAGTRVVLHFKDGERGDKDLTANGRIDDPGAPGIVGGSPIPTLNEWGMILFVLLLMGSFVWMGQRNRQRGSKMTV